LVLEMLIVSANVFFVQTTVRLQGEDHMPVAAAAPFDELG
jgi:hypothetical protein